MIDKLYKLKQTQLDQKQMLKRQLTSKIFDIENNLQVIQGNLNSIGVDRFGAIGDFKILAIQKNYMKYEQQELLKQKDFLEKELILHNKVIVQFQKKVEKYDYLLKEERKEKMLLAQKDEDMVASEYVLSKYAREATR
jgi:hypothetical protein